MDREYSDYRFPKLLTDRKITFVALLKDDARHRPLGNTPIEVSSEEKYGLYEMAFKEQAIRKICSDETKIQTENCRKIELFFEHIYSADSDY